jgi:hypothetical protein
VGNLAAEEEGFSGWNNSYYFAGKAKGEGAIRDFEYQQSIEAQCGSPEPGVMFGMKGP